MAHSIEFNTIDMSAYGLRITTPGMNLLSQLVRHIQLQERGYAFTPMREPRRLTIGCVVTAANLATLDGYLDAIKRILTQTLPKELVFDALSTRYFNALLESFEGEYIVDTSFRGTLSFICPDPLGYSTTLDSPNHPINADPKTIEENVGGTGYIEPVYTLTAGEVLTDVTIKIENIEGDEELQWGPGSVGNGKKLEIDVANWTVKNDGTIAMATVTGRFPRLRPNALNYIKVTGFLSSGSLNIKYRDTYL